MTTHHLSGAQIAQKKQYEAALTAQANQRKFEAEVERNLQALCSTATFPWDKMPDTGKMHEDFPRWASYALTMAATAHLGVEWPIHRQLLDKVIEDKWAELTITDVDLCLSAMSLVPPDKFATSGNTANYIFTNYATIRDEAFKMKVIINALQSAIRANIDKELRSKPELLKVKSKIITE